MAVLAIVRALILTITMGLFLLCYAITRIVLPHTNKSAFRLRRAWIKYVAMPILNIKTEVVGKPIEGAALYVSNHRSFIDPLIISQYLDAFIIAKAEIADYPIINKGAGVTGVIWVRRDSRDSRSATRQAYIDTIQGGDNVLVYPEGTISVDKTILSFNTGTFKEAAKQGFTVVPVVLEYRDESDMWTVDGLLKYYIRQCSKWSIETKLTFGPPIDGNDGIVLRDEAQKWVTEELDQIQSGWSRAFK